MKNRAFILLSATTLLLYGCHRNELCYDDDRGQVTLEVSWEKLPPELQSTLPESVGIMLYDGDNEPGSEPGGNRLYNYYRETFGGKLTLADGLYDYIVYNADTEYVQFRGIENFGTAEAFLPERTRTPYNGGGSYSNISYPDDSDANQATREEVIIREPDRIFATYAGRALITAEQDKTPQIISVQPESRVMFVDLDVTVCELQTARSYRGSLSGMTRSIRLNGDQRGYDTGTVIFDLQKTSDNTIGHSICIFGINGSDEGTPPEDEIQHILKLEFLMIDGQVAEYVFDIGDQLDSDNQQSEEHTPIELPCEEIELPEVEYPEGSFDATVEDWGERVDIYL